MGMWRIYRTAKRTAGKLRKFIALQSEMKLLLVEAYLFLAWGRLLKALPFHRIAPMLGSYMEETPDQPQYIVTETGVGYRLREAD